MKLGARYAAAIADIWVQAGGPVICPAKSEWQITNHNIGRTHQEKAIFAGVCQLELYLDISDLGLDSPGKSTQNPLEAQELFFE